MSFDVKAKVEELVGKLQKDPATLKSFQDDPIKTVEKLTGVDLPDEQLQPLVAGIKAKLAAADLGGKLDGLNSGVCSLGYDQLSQQSATNNLITTTGYNIERAAQANALATMQQFNAMAMAQQNCCCENRQLIADLKYDMATSDCSIKTLINQLVQQLMWGQQSGLRDLTDLINNKFCQLEMSQKDAIIADLRTQLAMCGDRNTANEIVARLTAVINPPAVPSFPAANPHGFGNWAPQVLSGGGWNGCNQGCGTCC